MIRSGIALRMLLSRQILSSAIIFAPLLVGLASNVRAGEMDLSKLPPAATHRIEFAKEIQPIFEANCYKCHGAEKQKSDFRLDLKSRALQGGEQGEDIVPGKSGQS